MAGNSPISNKKVYAHVQNGFLQFLMRLPIFALASHWIFQGMLYSDPTERIFKISLDLIGTALISYGLHFFSGWVCAIVISFLFIHTLNFIFNGQIWGVLKFFGYVNVSDIQFESYTIDFACRVRNNPSFTSALIFGSSCRGKRQASSDLDVRLLRKPGFRNGIKACAFLLTERTRAFFAHFPLDAYILDGEQSLKKMRKDEHGIDLFSIAPHQKLPIRNLNDPSTPFL